MAEVSKTGLRRADYNENGRLGDSGFGRHGEHPTAGVTSYRGVKGEAPQIPRDSMPSFPRGPEPRRSGGMNGNPESENSSDYRFTKLRGYGR